MLISSWLDSCKCPFAWISLSKDDDDFSLFLSYINVAIRKAFPESLSEFDMLLKVSEMAPFKVIEETLINELDEINKDFVLVLDDYHHIQSEEINNLLGSLLTFPPQHMHLVIITRRDPSLNFCMLRSRSRLNEIRMTELGF
jgi:LuxR family maltose regulon positive regulatory protein